MMSLSRRYVLAAVLPYTGLATLLLTGALLGQQFGRIADTGAGPVASSVIWQMLPSVLLFTLPTGALVGTLIGFARMASDGELTAMRAAGMSAWHTTTPVLVLGALLAAATLYVGLEAAPAAAQRLRRTVALAALRAAETPAQPRSFNTDLPGKVIYVRDGEAGRWGRVFIRSQERDGTVRLVTARSGRLDLSGEEAELVLADAMVVTLPREEEEKELTVERSAQLRVRLETGRANWLRALSERQPSLNEMSGGELLRAASQGAEARAAATLLHQRLALGAAPLIFALLGAGLGGRVRRGGRGAGVALAFAVMLPYYLVTLAGEQLGRTGKLPPLVGGWLATALAAAFALALIAREGRQWRWGLSTLEWRPWRSSGRRRALGLLDREVARALVVGFAVSLAALTGLFLIFTLFEMWRFVGRNQWRTLAEYLIYLWPFAAHAMAPLAALVAAMVTYGLMARRSEAVAWWSAGQSTYRLALPALVWAALLGYLIWSVQEGPLPRANRRQDALRAELRGVARAAQPSGRQWLASFDTRRLYSYEEYRDGALTAPEIYIFDAEATHLEEVISGVRARRTGGRWTVEQARLLAVDGTSARGAAAAVPGGGEPEDLFKQSLNKPALLSNAELSAAVAALAQRGDRPPLAPLLVAREVKRATPFAPFVMCLVAVPLALAFGRRSAPVPMAAAVLAGLAFWALASLLQLLGERQMLPPPVAGWAPVVLFGALGLYLLARART